MAHPFNSNTKGAITEPLRQQLRSTTDSASPQALVTRDRQLANQQEATGVIGGRGEVAGRGGAGLSNDHMSSSSSSSSSS